MPSSTTVRFLDTTTVKCLEDQVTRAKLALDTETRHRMACDAEAIARVERLRKSQEDQAVTQRKELEGNIEHLREDLKALEQRLVAQIQEQAETFRQALERERTDRATQARDLSQEVEASRREARQALANEDAAIRLLLEQEKTARNQALAELETAAKADAKADAAALRCELQDMDRAVRALLRERQDAEAELAAKLQALGLCLEVEKTSRAASDGNIERRISEVADALAAARTALTEDFEKKLRTVHNKSKEAEAGLKDSITKSVEGAKMDVNALGNDLREDLRKEKLARETQVAQLRTTLESYAEAQRISRNDLRDELVERALANERRLQERLDVAAREQHDMNQTLGDVKREVAEAASEAKRAAQRAMTDTAGDRTTALEARFNDLERDRSRREAREMELQGLLQRLTSQQDEFKSRLEGIVNHEDLARDRIHKLERLTAATQAMEEELSGLRTRLDEVLANHVTPMEPRVEIIERHLRTLNGAFRQAATAA